MALVCASFCSTRMRAIDGAQQVHDRLGERHVVQRELAAGGDVDPQRPERPAADVQRDGHRADDASSSRNESRKRRSPPMSAEAARLPVRSA